MADIAHEDFLDLDFAFERGRTLELQRSDCRVHGLVRGAHLLARPLYLMAF
jgi:hypothetical protein